MVFTGALLFHVSEKQHMCHGTIDSKCGLPVAKALNRAEQNSPKERVRISQRAESRA
jgi:hypothetical protein